MSNSRSDLEWIEFARNGDSAAWGELFHRYWRAARAAAFVVTGNFASAEDAAAEGFRQALTALVSLRDPSRFGPWLRAIVIRTARRQRSRGNTLHYAAVEDPRQPPDQRLEHLQQIALLQHALTTLREPLREAIALFYFEGYDTMAAARFLAIPEGTLRRRLHQGRLALRSAVEQLLQQGRSNASEVDRAAVERCRSLLDAGDLFGAMREVLVPARPLQDPQRALTEMFGEDVKEQVRTLAQQFLPSPAAHSPVAAAIRTALPGAGIRASRALVAPDGRSVYQLLQSNADAVGFQQAIGSAQLVEVLDVTWNVTHGTLDLRAVENTLQRLLAILLPETTVRFSSYGEPRYRTALEARIDRAPTRIAVGGVLRQSPDTAHVRLFLEDLAPAG